MYRSHDVLYFRGYPFEERNDFGVNAGQIGFRASDAPRHHADVGPSTVRPLHHQRTARIALTRKCKKKHVINRVSYAHLSVRKNLIKKKFLKKYSYQTRVFAPTGRRGADVRLENRLRKGGDAIGVFPHRHRHF